MDITLLDETTIKRARRSLLARGLMVPGDQNRARRLPSGQRPRVLDLMVPYSWYAAQKGGAQALREMNAWRAEQGLDALTPENRPDLAPAPAKKVRADKGRPRKTAEESEPSAEDGQGGAARPPLDTTGDQDQEEGGLEDPPREGLKTPQGVAESPPTNSLNLACDPANDDCGDGRRPPTGSTGPSDGGFAASDKMEPPSEKARPSDVRAVVQGIPAALRPLLERDWPRGLPDSVNQLISNGLLREHRTVGQLVERMCRRWQAFGYEDALLSQSGEGIRRSIGVLEEMLSPSKCWGNNIDCEDGIELYTGRVCPRCEETRQNHHGSSESGSEGDVQEPGETYMAPQFVPPSRDEAVGVNEDLARSARKAILRNRSRNR